MVRIAKGRSTRALSLWIAVSVASLSAFVFTGCSDSTLLAYVKAHSIPSFTVTSPGGLYYTTKPLLEYSVTSGVTVSTTLNGTPVTIANGQQLSGSVTGMNTLTIDGKDPAGNVVGSHQTIVYFLNDLNLTDADAFGGPPVNFTDGSNLGATLEIYQDTLAVRGALNVAAWGFLHKPYPIAGETKFLQRLDLVSIINQNSYILNGVFSTSSDSLSAQFGYTGSDYLLTLLETSPTYLPSPYYLIAASSSVPITLSLPASLWFYRNGSAYQAVVVDAAGSVAGSAAIPSYTPASGYGVLVRRGIVLAPYDATSSTAMLVRADNYGYYK